jgi:hypothetical protein
MNMAAQICETCKKQGSMGEYIECYCSPNSTCEGYEPKATEPNQLKAHLIQIRRMVQAMKIPNLMNASDGVLSEAREQKNEVIKYINGLIKRVNEEG